ncbi:MAG TPA: NINE protein [Candidatus Limnocylindrales bacterium]|nr:NINE protein [Candidatus Limnocylindrales bacterium]
MTPAVCPYCRGAVEDAEREATVCAGCGTPHHADCYAENGGCTVFGCSAAPEEEPGISVSGADLATPALAGGMQAQAPVARSAPPPPLNGAATAAPAAVPLSSAGSVLFRPAPVVPSVAAAAPANIDLTPDPNAKHQSTFILLGVFLGMFGGHSFYAGYKNKAFVQLGISVLTLGFASPMIWVWAIIDVFTIQEDVAGVKFRS